MNHHQQKSFAAGGPSKSNSQLDLPSAIIVWFFRKTFCVVEYLFVIAKYQFYKTTAVAPSSIRLPWSKLMIIALLGFIAVKREFSLSVDSGNDMTQFGASHVAEEVMSPNSNEGERPIVKLASLFEKKDPFSDDPSDDATTKTAKAYIRRFEQVAIAEKEKFGIPASVKMAQALVESNSGKSKLSRNNHNHFGIKCFSRSCKQGHCTNFGDDSHKDFFRKYETNWESWRAHSLLIAEGKYKTLLKHGDDYKKWARGLKEMGYATAKNYDQTLINTIEKYRLDLLDN